MFRTPCLRRIHSSPSATAVKILGAEHNPNGSMQSTKWLPCHSKPSSSRSSGWTGSRRYAYFTSSFASRVPFPKGCSAALILSTDMYCSEHSTLLIPEFTSPPSGKERSVIRRHLPGVRPLDMIPMRLRWISGSEPGWMD